jgi:hypothetical protein
LTYSCLAVASCSWASHARFHSAQPVGQLGVPAYSFSSWGCCVSSSVGSVHRIERIVLCSLEIGTHAASLPYGFEYVLFDVQAGERPYRTRGTCMVEGGPVGPHLRAGHRSSGASLRQPPCSFVLPLPALVGSLLVFALQPRVLSLWRIAAADSADLKNLLLKMRVACDRRRSEMSTNHSLNSTGNEGRAASCLHTILLWIVDAGNIKMSSGRRTLLV